MRFNIELFMCLAGNLFSMYIISRFFSIFFDTGASTKRKWARFSCYGFYYLLNSIAAFYFHWPPIMIIFTNVAGCMLVAWTYSGQWKYRICAALLIVTMSIVCENAVYYYLDSLHIEHIDLICILSTNLLFFMLVLLLQKAIDLKYGEEFAFLEWAAVVVIPVCSLFVSVIVLDDCKDEITVLIGGISMILINVFLFFLLNRVHKMYRVQLTLALLEQQNQAYESQMGLLQDSEERITSLRHDIKNHFLVLDQLAEQDDCGEIKNYIHSLMPLAETQQKLITTGNPIIDGFLNMKLNEASLRGANVKTNLKISKNIPIAPKDMSIVLGNLLDNAIKALSLCKQKPPLLAVTMRQEPGALLIEITNSYNGAVRKFGNSFQTTKFKKDGHGIGLKNVQRVVETYHGQMEIDYTEELFMVKLVMFIES
ncbi:MAG: GHKL domain-containing protein [Firmicutes bacterium]|nr:GHKL domain-containing protein [Bacillota bacterium]